jgi:hypothetical protein
MDRFEELLKDFGREINLPLHPDKNRLCRLNINDILHVQIESDEAKDRILIATFICDVPAGKFRENILKESLKANHFYPRVGTLAFSERNNKLALFEYVQYSNLTGEKLGQVLGQFIERADAWRLAIERGQTAPSTESGITKSNGSIFGLKT